MIGNPLRTKLFADWYSPKVDDAYIFYLIFKTSLVVGYVMAVGLWLTYQLDLHCRIGSFDICIPHGNPARAFSWSFGLGFDAIYLLFIFPFYAVMFKRNIDWENYDYLWWNKKWKMTDPIEKTYPLFRKVFICLCISFPATPALGIWLEDRAVLHGSYAYFVFLVLAYPLALSLVATGWFSWTVVFAKARPLYRLELQNRQKS